MKRLLFALALSGCALTQKGEALDVRYFTPEHVRPTLTSAATESAHGLRLGRVSSGMHLRERIAYRDGPYEIGYYDDRRWTERPEVYVRRRLARVLFEERGFTRSDRAPNLDVEVIAFEEVRMRDEHAARIVVRAVLTGDDGVLFEDTITAEERVARGASIEEVVAATARALDTIGDEIAKRVNAALPR
ncbi:MAG TPA: ABC-type transport auxiliary lipoprotein family protein [Labilithrix sp.]|jgi:cholesterol transport system auxiliary component